MNKTGLLIILFLVATSGTPRAELKEAALTAGQRLFSSSDWSTNGYACINCHSDQPESAKTETVKVAHSLFGAARRTQWNNGYITGDIMEAVDLCVDYWMQTPLLVRRDRKNLEAYLVFISPRPVTGEIVIKKAEQLPDNLLGDSKPGKKVFQRFCAGCHETKLAPVLKNLAYSPKSLAAKVRGLIPPPPNSAESPVRKMPFFQLERLSDQELADLVAYLVAY